MDFSRLDHLPEILTGNPNTEEFDRACQSLATFLLLYLRGRKLSPSDAESLAWDATGRIVLEIKKFDSRGQGSFAGWCLRVASNAFANWVRSAKKSGHVTPPELLDEVSYGASPSGSEVDYLGDSISQLAWQIVDSLGSRPKHVLIAHVLDGRTFPEIARELGLSEANARKIYERARKQLIELWRERLDNGGE